MNKKPCVGIRHRQRAGQRPLATPLQLSGVLAALAVMLALFAGTANARGVPSFDWFDFKLTNSELVTARSTIAPGEELLVTAILRNDATIADSINVTVQFPTTLAYVAGSASGATYHEGNRAVSWEGVPVGANGEARRTLRLRPAGPVSANTQAQLVAAIAGQQEHIIRFASVTLVGGGSAPPAGPNLSDSTHHASRARLGPGERMDYVITLRNTGAAAASVDVSDPLPARVSYVDASANAGGTYSAGSRTIIWKNIAVPAGETVELRFAVTATTTVESSTTVVNTVTITVGGTSLTRSAMVELLPAPPPGGADMVPPLVRAVSIGEQDVLTEADTTVRVVATDNVAVKELYLREWQLVTASGLPRWEVVRSSGWVEYQESLPWRLGSRAGTHYVGIWARDAAGNVSLLTPVAIDGAALLAPDTPVARGRAVIYQAYYPTGVTVDAKLITRSGDADLYVWSPGSALRPDALSNNEGTAEDAVSFTTSRAGLHFVVVVGYSDSRFDLTIAPAGGPQVAAVPATEAQIAAAPANGKTAPLLAALIGAGELTPLGSAGATSPAVSSLVYLPYITNR